MAVVAPSSMMFEGQDVSVWNHQQLDRLGRDALMKRAMNLRDTVGRDRLPNMPRHPEGLIRWIIEVQVAMSEINGAALTSQDFGLPAEAGSAAATPAPSSRAPCGIAHSYGGGSVAGTDASDAAEAFFEAKVAREAARARNQGTGIF